MCLIILFNCNIMLELIFLALVSLFVLCIVQSIVKPKKFPPGPRWYPYVGSIKVYSMIKQYGSQLVAFRELAKEYNTDVLGMNLGGEKLVVFFGEKNFKDVINAEEFDGRPDNFFIRIRCFGERGGISFADGPIWKIHRRFTITHLRNAGFGKGPMEHDIQQSVLDLVSWLNMQKGKTVSTQDFLSLTVTNVLWKCAAGETIQAEKWNILQNLLQQRGRVFSLIGGVLNRAPWTRFIMPGFTGYTLLVDINRQISEIVEEAILKHKNKEIMENDFINAFLQEIDQQKETFTDVQLKVVLLDLILAGSATTSNAVEFALLQVIVEQGMQKKIQDEIDLKLGHEQPSWKDSFRLTYTSAFLLEVQRLFTILPLVGPRRTLKDTEINGHIIPKDTTVILCVNDIHLDPNYWEEPNVFRPERFIDDKGNLKQAEHFYPFGLGRRRCPGDALARMYLFISFTSLLQNFSITTTDKNISTDPEYGIFATAKRFNAVFTPREPKIVRPVRDDRER